MFDPMKYIVPGRKRLPYGMVSIGGLYRGKTKFVIPNQVVRGQLYTYLLNTYNEAELQFDSYEKINKQSEIIQKAMT